MGPCLTKHAPVRHQARPRAQYMFNTFATENKTVTLWSQHGVVPHEARAVPHCSDSINRASWLIFGERPLGEISLIQPVGNQAWETIWRLRKVYSIIKFHLEDHYTTPLGNFGYIFDPIMTCMYSICDVVVCKLTMS
ncbi:hypothetical protein L1987_18508 [Smallanthus sonchifolius]|uniref:Uncharacterized protein n=1 Tax=Smallanthus sonchifolius TaxID=185202 RepID=A0ACB9IZS6_9ASTR|nr:hypothetical protein L1987_18508 [Smallanthus sonchifolius]